MAETEARKAARRAEGASGATDGAGEGAASPGAGNGQTEAPSAALSIHARMVAVLSELPAIGKTEKNEQQKFMFRSHDAVLNALNPLLAKHGIYVVPEVLERIPEKRTTGKGTTMYEVNLLVRYTFVAEDGSWIQASAWGEGTDMGDKSTNKAMTMAFKNVIAQAFAVSTQETIDTDATSPEETRAGAPSQDDRAEKMRERIFKLCEALDAQTKQEPGSWQSGIEEVARREFGVPFQSLQAGELEEVGKYLKAQQENGITEPPKQIDLSVPF